MASLLDFVGVLATAVVALSRVAFGVLVVKMEPMASRTASETRFSEGMSSRPVAWRLAIVAEETGDLRIDGIQRAIHAVVGGRGLTHSDSSFARALPAGCGSEEILSDGVKESEFPDS